MNSVVRRRAVSWLVIVALLIGLALPGSPSEAAGGGGSGIQVLQSEHEVAVIAEQYVIRINKEGFKYSFEDGSGRIIAPAHSESGIKFGSAATGALYDASTTELIDYDDRSVRFSVTNMAGHRAIVRIVPFERYAKFQIEPEPFHETQHALQGEGSTRAEALLWGGSTAWEDYTLELDMRQSRRDASSTSGVLVRYQDYNNFYHVRYHLDSNKLQLLKKRSGGALTVVQEAAVPGAFNSSKLYTMTVAAEGNRLRGYLDDVLLLDYTDELSPILNGAVGMRIYSDVTQYSKLSVTSGETVLMDESALDSLENWNLHNGKWQRAADQPARAIIDARTAPLNPGYGMGDFAHNLQSTNVFGLSNNDMTNKGADQRFVSNFTIFPAHGFAQVLFENGKKRVTINASENKLGVDNVGSVDALYYFTGSMEQIYEDYQRVRIEEGYPVYKPKYDFFEVGYEAFGSLGWNTYQTSVMNDLQTYLDKGYKLKWGVVGSGFWKGDRNAPTQGATTSFGIWDDEAGPPRADGLPNPRYPDVEGLKQFFRDNDMNLLLGLRINFKAMRDNGGQYTPEHDGPFPVEGIENGYFLSDENGVPSKYSVNFPSGSVHLLDTYNEAALDWYADGVKLWGVDGFKEDTMMITKPYQDGLWNNADGRLMEEGYQVMVRNAAYSVPGDILRLEDTQHGHNQDRPIINALNYAASGAPNVYSDIVAGKYLTLPLTQDQKLYFVRNAMWAATTPAMSVGLGPWHMENDEYEAAVKKAVDFHTMYAPYIYSAAIDSYHTGFPYTMTPLPIAYPDDERTYQLANRTTRQYEWMLGPSMLAVPAYGQDYATVTARDVYLPEGKWIDFETGQTYDGPVTLERYSLPIDKIPVFIGGKGVVVKRDLDSGKLLAEVYPIANNGSSYTYTYPDGETASTIVNGNTGWNHANLRITDTALGQEIDFEYNERTGSFTFELTEGHNYELSGGEFEGTLAELNLPQNQLRELISDETIKLQVEARLDSGELVDPNSLDLVYETDRPDIIAVNAEGEVKPLRNGTAMVRVSAAKGDGFMHSPWLEITVLEPELVIEEPAHLAELTEEPIIVKGTSRGLAELEARYNGIVQPIAKGSDGAWQTAIGRLENGEYGIQIVGRDKTGRIRLAEHIQVELNASDVLLNSEFEESSEPWSIENGSWSLAEADARRVYRGTGRGLTYAGNTSWRDYRVEADMMMASPSSIGGSAGLVFRFQNSGNFYHVRFDDNRSSLPGVRTIQLYKWVSGAASKIAEAPFEFQYNEWYTMAVEVEGDMIRALVDGEVYLEANDPSLSSGAVGIRTYDRNTSIDRVTVSRLAPGSPADHISWRNGSAEIREATDSEVTLSWTGDVRGVQEAAQYRIYVNNEPVEAQLVDNTAVVSGLARGQLYAFKIEAGEESMWSTDGPVAVYRMPAEEQPGVPTAPIWVNGQLAASSITQTRMTLSWSGAHDESGITHYRIDREGAEGIVLPVETLAEADGVYSYTATGLSPGTAYRFTVQAGNEDGLWSADGPSVQAATLRDSSNGGDGGNGGGSGGGGGGQAGGNEPEGPDDAGKVRVVTEAELEQALDDGWFKIKLEGQQSSVQLPAAAVRLDDGTVIRIEADGFRVELAAEALRELAAAAAGDESIAAIVVDVGGASLTATQRRALGDDLRLSGAAARQVAVNLELKNGEKVQPMQLPEGGQMGWEYDASAVDSELLGIYRFDEDAGKWVYIGAEADASQGLLAAKLSVPGIYAVMERHKTFSDVADTHWAYRTLQVLSARHIVNGVDERHFAPSGVTTRAEFTALLVRALGLQGGAGSPAKASAEFSDVAANAWYAGDVAAAHKAGLVQGVTEGQFAPQAHITREQMAVMIVRAFEYANGRVETSGEELGRYTDSGELSAWSADAVKKAVAAGLMQGTAADAFTPRANATRAQTAQAVYNLLELLRGLS